MLFKIPKERVPALGRSADAFFSMKCDQSRLILALGDTADEVVRYRDGDRFMALFRGVTTKFVIDRFGFAVLRVRGVRRNLIKFRKTPSNSSFRVALR